MSKAAELAEFGGGISNGPNAVEGLAKAWSAFNASSGTPTNLDNLNVTSLTDTATGRTTLNFTNSFANTSYATNATNGGGGNKNAVYQDTATSSVLIRTQTMSAQADTDHDHVSSSHHGDLA
jgi:hypothetical protein